MLMVAQRISQTRLSSDQLEIFQLDPQAHLFGYWRKQLQEWPTEVFQWRHYPDSTGWSMATQGFTFARLLHNHGQLSNERFQRYQRFDAFIRARDQKVREKVNNERL